MNDDRKLGNDTEDLTSGEQSQESEYGERGRAAAEGSEEMFGAEGAKPRKNEDDGMSGQPIGGNDGASGTGTTLTQGADFDESEELSRRQSGFVGSRSGDDSRYLQEDRSSSPGSGAPPDDAEESAARSFSGADQLSDADGSNFAREGQGALDDEDEDGKDMSHSPGGKS